MQILLNALAARGQHYAPVIVRSNFTAQAPGLFGPNPATDLLSVGLTERTAIIARTDLPTDLLQLSNPRSGDFAVASSVPTLTAPFSVGGGWLSVDAKVRGKRPDTIVNPNSQLHERVDYVFAGPGVQALDESLVGADPSARIAPSGLWPTDHAGLAATLGLEPLPASLGN